MRSKSLFKVLTYWNRKLHIHLGLFLLLFVWLFSFSGLLLNHGQWKFANFWEEREEKSHTTALVIPTNIDSASILSTVMQQLKISGEVSEVALTADSVDFRVTAPGR